MMPLYENIRKRRIELGMSQGELAEKLGYTSRSTIAKIEAGVNDITQSKIVAFAEALKTTPAYLMGWDEEEPPTHREDAITDIIIRLRKDEKFLNLVETLKEYPEERIDAISAMISAFEK
jgi:transcriptional regulator with XRE-family HTH domain